MQKFFRGRLGGGRHLAIALGLIALLVSAALNGFHRSAGASARNGAAHKDQALRKYAGMPLYFERNIGQSDPSVRYLSHSARSSLFLTDDAAVIAMVAAPSAKRRAVSLQASASTDQAKTVESAIRISLLGANPHPQFEPIEPFTGRVNYLIGNDPSKYHTDVPIFGRIKEKNIYPGVDLIYYGNHDSLEYDLIAAPGADISKLRFAIEGGSNVTLDREGNLIIAASAGAVVLHKPQVSEQDARGKHTPVAGTFKMVGTGAIEAGIAR
ncbi:MAG TPA: hypothetical protein VMT64_11515, partial [Candidatus Binataceae bacterium]|nr:hypothetical protein [Candidatus Binataceae bacterium]